MKTLGLTDAGDTVRITHEGHARDGQTVTVLAIGPATGGTAGGAWVTTDHGPMSRYTRVESVDEPDTCQYCERPIDESTDAVWYSTARQTDHLACVPASETAGEL